LGHERQTGPGCSRPAQRRFSPTRPSGGRGEHARRRVAPIQRRDGSRLIDAEVRRVLDESYADALRLLRQQRHELDALATALLEHETLDEQEILRVTGLRPAPRPGVLQLPVSVPVAAFGRNGTTSHNGGN
jgi:hypothetical protein